MSNRRDFLKLSVAFGGVSTLAACSNLKETQSASTSTSVLPSGVIYSRSNPGKWAKKVGGHAPIVTVKGNIVTVETNHGMSRKHYIVRHTIVSLNGKVLGTNTFSSEEDEPISTFTLPSGYEDEELYATSFCNKHDMWVEKFKV